MTTGNNTVRFNPNLYRDGKVCLSILGSDISPPVSSHLSLSLSSLEQNLDWTRLDAGSVFILSPDLHSILDDRETLSQRTGLRTSTICFAERLDLRLEFT